MTDLISRADAIEAKPEYRNEDMWDKEKSTYNKGWNDCNDAWVAIIKALPSADAVQGEWVDWLGNGNEWECSVCQCSVESHGSIAYNYCPMCGARMKPYKGGDTE